MKRKGQNKMIAHFMINRQCAMTTLIAANTFRICRLSERMRELDALGFTVKRDWITLDNARVVKYSMPRTKSNLKLYNRYFA